MMTPGFDPASVAEAAEEPAAHTLDHALDRALDQFEPDNDGTWDGTRDGPPDSDPVAAAPSLDGDDDPRWIVWADAVLESAWAGSELATSWLAVIRIPPTR